jgi:soluble lytic murein transglycosylase-like protein
MTLLAVCLLAGEIAVLNNGFELRIDSHELRGEDVFLRIAGGETVMPKSAIVRFELLPEEPEPVAVAAIAPQPEQVELTPQEMVRSAALKHGLPPEFVEAVARQESAFNPKAISHKGAIGLMQLMPATAKALGVDPHDPEQNSEAGARLLRELLLQYQDRPDQVRRALAAYNAGAGAVQKYNGVPPYRETVDYVERVLQHYKRSSATGKP